MQAKQLLFGALLVLGLCTNSGESSNPSLGVAELPADVLRECATGGVSCGMDHFDIRWVSRLPDGHLFLVNASQCDSDGCDTWLVAKDEQGATRVMLTVTGEVRIEQGSDRFPVVRTRSELSESYTSYARYDWTGDQYTRTETRLVHRVDDMECGDEDDCDAVARRALKEKQASRAVRIWQQVHGVNWI